MRQQKGKEEVFNAKNNTAEKDGKESIKLHNQNVLICKDYPG